MATTNRPDLPRAIKPSLPWGTAARIAWRELRASKAKFAFVLLSVAIGVAALTGVRGFSQAFQKALLGDARSLMAADLSARLFRQTSPKEAQQLDALQGRGAHGCDGDGFDGLGRGRSRSAAGFVEGCRSGGVSVLWDGGASSCGDLARHAYR